MFNNFNYFFNKINKKTNKVDLLNILLILICLHFFITHNYIYFFKSYVYISKSTKCLYINIINILVTLFKKHLDLPKILYCFCILYHIEVFSTVIDTSTDPFVQIIFLIYLLIIFLIYESSKANEYGYSNLFQYYKCIYLSREKYKCFFYFNK